MLESICCFECGKPIDVTNELYRTMDAYHEKDNPATMPITAHEHCIVDSPNERNWRHAQWGPQAVRGFIEMKRFQLSMHEIQRLAGYSPEQISEGSQAILDMASDEKKVYICNDCKQAWDAEKYGKWVETYMSNLMVWVCWDCLKEDQSLRK